MLSLPQTTAPNTSDPLILREPASLDSLSQESARASRLAFAGLAIGLVGFIAWATVAPLDEGVPSQGLVAIDTKRKAVQHLNGGIVKEVHVREGDLVREGQLLMRLDSAASRANYEAVRQRYYGLRATQSRLIAEQAGAGTVRFHPELEAAAAQDPLIRQQMATQQQLFTSTRAALHAELQGLQEGIRGQEMLAQSYRAMEGSRRNQLALLNDELASTRALVKDGYAPRNRQLELERMVAESHTALSELQGSIARSRQAVAEMRQKVIQRQQDYRRDVEGRLTEAARDVEGDEGKFRALADDLERVDIKSPATGQVVGLAVQSQGAVVQSGQKLMDIVPGDEPLLIETRVSPHLVDRVRAGLPVDVRFSAFAHSPQLVVDGSIVSISADLLTDPQTNASYYLARVSLTPEGKKKLGARALQPGMPVEVVLKTGERSLLAYLLHPLTKRLAAAMKEE